MLSLIVSRFDLLWYKGKLMKYQISNEIYQLGQNFKFINPNKRSLKKAEKCFQYFMKPFGKQIGNWKEWKEFAFYLLKFVQTRGEWKRTKVLKLNKLKLANAEENFQSKISYFWKNVNEDFVRVHLILNTDLSSIIL